MFEDYEDEQYYEREAQRGSLKTLREYAIATLSIVGLMGGVIILACAVNNKDKVQTVLDQTNTPKAEFIQK